MVAGKRKGLRGWLDKINGKKNGRYHVVLAEGEHENLSFKYCEKYSFVLDHEPTNRLEACMSKHPKLEICMEELGRLLARADIGAADKDFCEAINKKIARGEAWRRKKEKSKFEVNFMATS